MIKVEHISKSFRNVKVLDDISFEVQDGEILGILGPNGAGKTTTLNIISGLLKSDNPDTKIEINGIDLIKNPVEAKKQVGYMAENAPLYTELTTREFIKFMAELRMIPKNEREDAINEAIERTSLEKAEDVIIKSLSRGYKQRVSLAGTIVGMPDVLILDEPTIGLDPEQIKDTRDMIKELTNEHTVIFSSHILSEVEQLCDKIVVINNGKIYDLVKEKGESLEDAYLRIVDMNKKALKGKELRRTIKRGKKIAKNNSVDEIYEDAKEEKK